MAELLPTDERNARYDPMTRDELIAECELLRADLAIQAVNATAVLQAQHERDCAVEDVKRLSDALECLLPGLILDLRYATDDDDKDAMQSRVRTVQDALAGTADDVGDQP